MSPSTRSSWSSSISLSVLLLLNISSLTTSVSGALSISIKSESLDDTQVAILKSVAETNAASSSSASTYAFIHEINTLRANGELSSTDWTPFTQAGCQSLPVKAAAPYIYHLRFKPTFDDVPQQALGVALWTAPASDPPAANAPANMPATTADTYCRGKPNLVVEFNQHFSGMNEHGFVEQWVEVNPEIFRNEFSQMKFTHFVFLFARGFQVLPSLHTVPKVTTQAGAFFDVPNYAPVAQNIAEAGGAGGAAANMATPQFQNDGDDHIVDQQQHDHNGHDHGHIHDLNGNNLAYQEEELMKKQENEAIFNRVVLDAIRGGGVLDIQRNNAERMDPNSAARELSFSSDSTDYASGEDRERDKKDMQTVIDAEDAEMAEVIRLSLLDQ